MAFQAMPSPTVWMVLSDGEMIAMTYSKEQDLLAWHRHDTDGSFVDVASVREGDTDRVYVLVDRPCDGGTRRILERLSDTRLDPDEYRAGANFSDSAVAFDGRNTNAENLFTITSPVSGTSWAGGQYNVTFTSATLLAADATAGNQIFIYYDDTILPCTVLSISSATAGIVLIGTAIPTAYQNVGTASWGKAIKTISGLQLLAGKAVNVFADGAVVACPHDAALTTATVSALGTLTLTTPVCQAFVGLPYLVDVETLDIEDNSPTLVNMSKNISCLALYVEESLGIYAGREDPGDSTPIANLAAVQADQLHDLGVTSDKTYKMPYTGVVRGLVKGKWDTRGRVFLRKIHPVPFSLLSVYIPFEMETDRG
jgi:hypothetical protein